jgi:hypothetical protein
MEHEALLTRSLGEDHGYGRSVRGNACVCLGHVLWFGLWIVANVAMKSRLALILFPEAMPRSAIREGQIEIHTEGA